MVQVQGFLTSNMGAEPDSMLSCRLLCSKIVSKAWQSARQLSLVTATLLGHLRRRFLAFGTFLSQLYCTLAKYFNFGVGYSDYWWL